MAKEGGGQPTSMLQGLQSILSALGGMMAAPDADVPFLQGLQHVIVDQIKKKTQQSVAGAGQQPGGMPRQPNQIAPGGGGGMSGFGAGAGAPGGPMAAPGSAPPPGMGAPGMGGAGAPNPDELRRVLGANAQAA